MVPKSRIRAGLIFPSVSRVFFPGWGFVFLKSQAAKNSPLVAHLRYLDGEPALECVELTFQAAALAAWSPLAPTSCAGLFKEAALPLVCLKSHLMGKAGGWVWFLSLLK